MSTTLTQDTVDRLDNIRNDMANGQWSSSEQHFKKLNCSAREFSQYIEDLNNEQLKDFTLLGFYSKEFIPSNKEK